MKSLNASVIFLDGGWYTIEMKCDICGDTKTSPKKFDMCAVNPIFEHMSKHNKEMIFSDAESVVEKTEHSIEITATWEEVN